MGKYICCLAIVLFSLGQNAYANNCENLSFEKGDFSNWTGKTWLHFYSEILNLQTGIEPGRHTIMCDTSAYDKNTGGKLKLIPPGYKYSARLGDSISGCRSQSLSYTLKVDSTNALFIWKFAVVLQDPLHEHLSDEQPRFKITLEDQDGNIISSCSQYDVNAAEGIPGFHTYYPPGFTRDTDSVALVVWRDWTTAGANLMPFYGKKVTITFTSEDCTKQGHYGYAYFVAECRPLEISVNYCKDDTDARLEAPDGFSNYVWTPGNIEGRRLTVNNATIGNEYTCSFQSVMGCQVDLTATIKRTTPTAAFNFTMTDAAKRAFQFNNTSSASSGTLAAFSWDFGDGSSSTDENPVHSFATAGKHTIALEVTSLPSGCKNRTSKELSITIPTHLTLTGDSAFCSGQSATLTANGKIKYLWNTGDTIPTIKVVKGGTYSVTGWDEQGTSETISMVVKENRTPIVTITGTTKLCPGQSTTLIAKGADNYHWNNDETSESIVTSTEGTYSVVGYLANGCVSPTTSVTVTREATWQPIITGDSLFCANTATTLTASEANTYKWNTGSTAQSITISQEGTYVVVGTNKLGCQSQASMRVTKIPIPDATFAVSPDKLNIRNPVISVNITKQEELNYEWQLGDGTIKTGPEFSHKYEVSNTTTGYTITLNVINKYGCTNSASQSILLDLKVPNVFTPNNDGYNDRFMADYDLQIFDRNGILLYSGYNGWDGTYKGARLDPDVYFYLLKYTDANNHNQIKKGFVMLVR